jgi:hypothetical protein
VYFAQYSSSLNNLGCKGNDFFADMQIKGIKKNIALVDIKKKCYLCSGFIKKGSYPDKHL